MATLQIDIQDDIITLFGMKSIKKFIDEELNYQRFRLLEMEIQSALADEEEVDWHSEFENARSEAYKEFYTNNNRDL